MKKLEEERRTEKARKKEEMKNWKTKDELKKREKRKK